MKQREKTILLCQTAMFAALIFVLTAYLHIPSHTGYTHVGDGVLYFAACLLPTPYAAAAGAIGAGLADLLSGYAIWMPGTVVIKALTALCFSNHVKRGLSVRNLLGLLPAWGLCIGGYYLYECLITGNWIAPLAGIAGYTTQCIGSSILYVVLLLTVGVLPSKVFDRA